MLYHQLNVQSPTRAFEFLSNLARLHYFLCADRQYLLIVSKNGNALLSSIKKTTQLGIIFSGKSPQL